ncbi:MAG: tRNA modification GTPase MnmE [Planctomycetaceae bacterium]|nr:MAG: tRNA modification GTPase MnmE [Planctomycetaceae bacterium]
MPEPKEARVVHPTAPAIAACWTPIGRGALALVRVHAAPVDTTWFRPRTARWRESWPLQRPMVGAWGRAGEAAEDVVVCRLAETVWEVTCHGGQAAVQRILHDLQQAGIRIVTPDELAQQVYAPWEFEARRALQQTLTLTQAKRLNQQLQRSRRILRHMLHILTQPSPDIPSLTNQLAAMLQWKAFGLKWARPALMVLVGRPNVGKSSLLNTLVGYQRAIVSPLAGTTRDPLTALTAFDGWPCELCDTAGWRTTSDPLEAAGIARSQRRISQADLVLLLLDLSQPLSPDDQTLLAQFPQAIRLAHKCDLTPCWHPAQYAALPVSSLTQQGLPELIEHLRQALVPELPPEGQIYPVTPRQAEWLEQLYRALTQHPPALAEAQALLQHVLAEPHAASSSS